MAALGQAPVTFGEQRTMTGYLLLTKGEDSLARRGALVIIRAVCRSEIGNLGRGFGMSWRAKLTGWARRRKSSRLSQRQLYHATTLATDHLNNSIKPALVGREKRWAMARVAAEGVQGKQRTAGLEEASLLNAIEGAMVSKSRNHLAACTREAIERKSMANWSTEDVVGDWRGVVGRNWRYFGGGVRLSRDCPVEPKSKGIM